MRRSRTALRWPIFSMGVHSLPGGYTPTAWEAATTTEGGSWWTGGAPANGSTAARHALVFHALFAAVAADAVPVATIATFWACQIGIRQATASEPTKTTKLATATATRAARRALRASHQPNGEQRKRSGPARRTRRDTAGRRVESARQRQERER